MKKVLIIILYILLTSFTYEPFYKVRQFHVKMVGEAQVEKFEKQYPQITRNHEVYVAYLSIFYKGNEDEYINLILKN